MPYKEKEGQWIERSRSAMRFDPLALVSVENVTLLRAQITPPNPACPPERDVSTEAAKRAKVEAPRWVVPPDE